jgi:hypothetical protein
MLDTMPRTRALALAATAASVTAGVAIIAPQVASADTADESTALACRTYQDNTNQFSPDGDGYWYTNWHNVPTSSPCHDIQISMAPKQGCALFRVHFPNVANNGFTHQICDTSWTILKFDVPDGQQYRIESDRNVAFTVGD